jgi:hypothetical protein
MGRRSGPNSLVFRLRSQLREAQIALMRLCLPSGLIHRCALAHTPGMGPARQSLALHSQWLGLQYHRIEYLERTFPATRISTSLANSASERSRQQA